MVYSRKRSRSWSESRRSPGGGSRSTREALASGEDTGARSIARLSDGAGLAPPIAEATSAGPLAVAAASRPPHYRLGLDSCLHQRGHGLHSRGQETGPAMSTPTPPPPDRAPHGGWRVLVDFDGTITERDADFVIADSMLGGEAQRVYGPIVAAYEQLHIGLRDYFERMLALLPMDRELIEDHLGGVVIRPGVHELVAWCAAASVDLEIVTEGLDLYVCPLLQRAGLADVPLSCNRAQPRAGGYRIVAPHDSESCERCLNCKGARVRRAQRAGQAVAIVGDGASDLCAARCADLVLARDGLRRHCERENIDHLAWDSFADVLGALRVHAQPSQPGANRA